MLKLYNTLSRRLEEFKSIEPGVVRMYTCGPTVYDTAHIGNFRTFMFEDLLKRYLLYSGYTVRHVMNITDVDDKTIERAEREKITLKELTTRYIDQFKQDLAALNILPADHLPRATDFMSQMAVDVQILLNLGHAYVAKDGSVYFDVSSYPEYGQLARLDPDQQILAHDNNKRNPQDFALWKAHKPEDGNNLWPGCEYAVGRPGWHIECSTMSTHYLGTHLDIHCGGVDNIFPHHENELAQNRCLNPGPFVNLWLHSEHLLIDGQKMAKSWGNYHTLRDLLDLGLSAEAVRYTLLTTHYRQRLNFSVKKVQESQKAIDRLRELARRLMATPHQATSAITPALPDLAVMDALDNDLNIAKAMGVIFTWARYLFTLMDREELDSKAAANSLAALHRYDRLLGVVFTDPITPSAEITELIAQRTIARRAKDWAKADKIRDKLIERHVRLEDTLIGTVQKHH